MGPRTDRRDTRVATLEPQVTDEDRDTVSSINKRLNLDRPLSQQDASPTLWCPPTRRRERWPRTQGDWTKLSRKHDRTRSRYGSVERMWGDYTDCINVGNEVCESLESMGISLPFRDYQWYDGSQITYYGYAPGTTTKLDEMAAPRPAPANAFGGDTEREPSVCSRISKRSRNTDILIETSEYIRCESIEPSGMKWSSAAGDFLRRRSKVSRW